MICRQYPGGSICITPLGDWLLARGNVFPPTTKGAPPNGAMFWHTDELKLYGWDRDTETWVAVGDFIEIKVVCPTWATNPATVAFGGTVYVE